MKESDVNDMFDESDENKCDGCLFETMCRNSEIFSSFCLIRDERMKYDENYPETSWSEFKSNRFYKKTNRFIQENFELDEWQLFLLRG